MGFRQDDGLGRRGSASSLNVGRWGRDCEGVLTGVLRGTHGGGRARVPLAVRTRPGRVAMIGRQRPHRRAGGMPQWSTPAQPKEQGDKGRPEAICERRSGHAMHVVYSK